MSKVVHVTPYLPEVDCINTELAPNDRLTPWELGYVGAKEECQVASSSKRATSPGTDGSGDGNLSVYELQPIDVGQNSIQLTSRSGQFLSPDIQLEDIGADFVAVNTNSDGGCALHSVWGQPNATSGFSFIGGQLEARKLCCNMLPDSWESAQIQFGDWDLFQQIVLSLWTELAEPGAQRTSDREANIF